MLPIVLILCWFNLFLFIITMYYYCAYFSSIAIYTFLIFSTAVAGAHCCCFMHDWIMCMNYGRLLLEFFIFLGLLYSVGQADFGQSLVLRSYVPDTWVVHDSSTQALGPKLKDILKSECYKLNMKKRLTLFAQIIFAPLFRPENFLF